MVFDRVFQPFIEQSAVSVMFRGMLENVFSTDRLDDLFEATSEKQYCRELTFSTCAQLLSLVVTKVRPSLNASYAANREQIAVSVQAVYQKIAGVEPCVSEALVRHTARDLAAIIDRLPVKHPGPLSGYEVRIVDGNHLQGTQHRLKELRRLGDAALPGHSLAVLNPHRQLIEDLVVCTDGHANQKPLLRQLLDKVQVGECWIGDRDYSTREFMFGVQRQRGYFIVRQHGALQGELQGRRRRVGRTDTGMVYEQKIRLTSDEGDQLTLRRITIELDRPTRDHDEEIHLLTNLPKKVLGCRVARAYLSRWSIEAAFHKLTKVLRCELNTLGYPEAALFGFSLAVVMYNALSTVMSALQTVHPQVAENGTSQSATKSSSKAKKFSFYYLADEIAGVSRGMAIVIPADRWTLAFAQQTPWQMAQKLLYLASHVDITRFLINPVSEKKRKARRPIKHGGHVATSRILQQRTSTKK